jgi:hypothetical protein
MQPIEPVKRPYDVVMPLLDVVKRLHERLMPLLDVVIRLHERVVQSLDRLPSFLAYGPYFAQRKPRSSEALPG